MSSNPPAHPGFVILRIPTPEPEKLDDEAANLYIEAVGGTVVADMAYSDWTTPFTAAVYERTRWLLETLQTIGLTMDWDKAFNGIRDRAHYLLYEDVF